MNTTMSLDYAGDQLFVPNIVRAVGQALMLAPLSAVSLGSVAPQDAAAASGISNMMRNLGGAIGTALLATIVTKREQFHSNIIGQSVDLGREEVRSRIAQMTDYFMAHGVTDPAAAHHQAIIALGNAVKRQALVLGFSDSLRGARRGAAARGRRHPPHRKAEGRSDGRRRALKTETLRFAGAALAGRATPLIAVDPGRNARHPDRRFLAPIGSFRRDALRHSRTGQDR